jgi:antitoxin component YwqK of YwqJK toxin-antitoxin module
MSEVRVTTKQLTYPDDGLHYLHGKPFTGVLEYHFRNGNLEAEEEYKDGLLSGFKRTWYLSVQLQLEAECDWGGFHGKLREWHENGQLAREAVYEYGIRIHATRWDTLGIVVEEFQLTQSDPGYEILEASRAGFEEGGQKR